MTGLQTAGAIASIVTTGVTTLTLIVLIWYTIETHKLRREARRQNEVSVMPMLAVLNDSPSDRDNRRILLINVGRGPAFNLSIDPLRWEGRELQIEHGGNIIRPDETKELQFHFQEQNSGTMVDVNGLYLWINTGKIPDPLHVIVRCQSVNSMAHTSTFKCTPDAGRLKITFEGVKSDALSP